jgi:hypothetical protein
MDKRTIMQRMQFQNEFESLVWQMMSRVKRGETLPESGQYQRVAQMLRERARFIETTSEADIQHESDWLALALYGDDRAFFAQMCLHAQEAEDPVYLNAEKWLKRIIEKTLNQLGFNSA